MDQTNAPQTVIALGNFDGVHLGHAALIKKCVECANALGLTPTVWTLERHSYSPPYICDRDERLRLLRSLGAIRVEFADFEAIRRLTPREFVRDVLISRYGCAAAVCGFNFRFGVDRSGDAETLASLSSEYGIGCAICDEVSYDGQPVSSTRIRQSLAEGDIPSVNAMLGRAYAIDLPIVHGRQVGRRLDMPTMNQRFPDGMAVPRHGVYAGRVEIDGRAYACVTNIGVRPTFDDGGGVVCESHVLDFSGELYGRRLRLELVRFLRDEIRFASPELLVAQIKRDIAETLRIAADK